ncbi:MAG: hypothetical protein V1918_05910 [Planctomycetota bacterium]
MDTPPFQDSKPEMPASAEGWKSFPPGSAHRKGKNGPIRSFFFLMGLVILVLMVSAFFGWVGGSVVSWYHQYEAERQYRDIVKKGDDDPQAFVLFSEKEREFQPRDPLVRLRLAYAYLALAPMSDNPEIYYSEAAQEANIAWLLAEKAMPARIKPFAVGSPAFLVQRTRADILVECGDPWEKQALNIYDDLLKIQPPHDESWNPLEKASLLNNAAYLLLTANDPAVYNPARGHELAIECVKLEPKASKNPAFLDTLALSYFEMQNPLQALLIQRDALARASSNDLHVYLEHFDMIQDANGP